MNFEDPPMTWRAVANNHGDRFRGTLRIGLFTTPSIHGRESWLRNEGDPNHGNP